MNNSNKAIAKRINKELKLRNWSQTDLLEAIIKFKNPNYSKADIYKEKNAKKGNFSTSLKGKEDRSISKEDLYIVAKVFGLPLEYIWFGDEKKSCFIPNGARYAAYQDSDEEYRAYISQLDYEDKAQYPDEFGFNLFDYFGQFDSINGYRFFLKNYKLHFDYDTYGQLMYVNGEGHLQFCSSHSGDKKDYVSENLIEILSQYGDVKTFKAVYFENSSIRRFSHYSRHANEKLFGNDSLKTLLQNESFLEQTLIIKTIDLHDVDERNEKGEKRNFVEPMFFEILDYALEHEQEFNNQLEKLLHFAIDYNKSQYLFIKDYLKEHSAEEHGDVCVDPHSPRFLQSTRYVQMGNIISINKKTSNELINELINESEQYAFNMLHIINEQEMNKEEIKISTPDNPLFMELHETATTLSANYVPTRTYYDKEFTYFKFYDSTAARFDKADEVQSLVDLLNKSQQLVKQKDGKVLVHGNISGQILMVKDGEIVGLAGWQKCHYGDKYEDRAEILSNVDVYYSFEDKFIPVYKSIFEVVSQGFDKKEQAILLDRAIELINKKKKEAIKNEETISKAFRLKERSAKLEFFKEVYLEK